ncbi:MAG TPA: nicotinate (nicotinamide) nucleotide adenylyltransferase [Bacilli bacterium]|nr:nicotinate (nicotinamide) nucleotide adenylyltransferase [Bacilli bacterium]
MKRILLGGSFDPIHDGHFLMANVAREQLKADIVEFVLAPRSRWKEGAIDVEERLSMLKAYLNDVPWARICLYEIKQNADINYTIETIKHFRAEYKDDELFLLIGADQLDQFDKWHEAKEISKLAQIVCYRRPGYNLSEKNLREYNVKVIEGEESNISSSAIRGLFSLDTKDEVIDYIVDHKLYFMHKIANYIGKVRIKHSVEVAKMARRIAESNNLDKKKAFLAGLLHDIAKEMPSDNAEFIMGTEFPQYHYLYKGLHHQFIGEFLARTSFNVSQEDVLDAIMWHTTGKPEMSWLGKVIYSADKIEPSRPYDSNHLIEACLKDYEQGFLAVLKENREFLLSKKVDLTDKFTQACFDYYLK